MEILSDATFKGDATFNKNVTISGGDFSLFGDHSDNPLVLAKHDTTEFLVNGVLTISRDADVGTIYLKGTDSSIPWINVDGYGKSYTINFPRQGGTLALTSQIPSIPSVEGFLKYKIIPIDFDVSADCTVFAVTNSGDQVHIGNIVSLNLFKGGIMNGCSAIKQVQADVWATYSGLEFIVEKSSAFAISSSDGYSIRASYYKWH